MTCRSLISFGCKFTAYSHRPFADDLQMYFNQVASILETGSVVNPFARRDGGFRQRRRVQIGCGAAGRVDRRVALFFPRTNTPPPSRTSSTAYSLSYPAIGHPDINASTKQRGDSGVLWQKTNRCVSRRNASTFRTGWTRTRVGKQFRPSAAVRHHLRNFGEQRALAQTKLL